MKITRTGNAGVLIETKGIKILIDGVCEHLPPYEETPMSFREEMIQNPPDVLLFTHNHKDHYDSEFARIYKEKTLRPVYGAGCPPEIKTGDVEIIAIPTRHIGKTDIPHCSFIVKGDRCVWFAGDASPIEWKGKDAFPKPDAFVVPYAYTITQSGWKIAKSSGAEKIVLLHLPQRELDEYKLWDTTEAVTNGDLSLLIPQVGEPLVV